jgi:hypothetical protein
VNDVKTPIAYNGINRSTLASVASRRTIAAPDRNRMSFEKTSR